MPGPLNLSTTPHHQTTHPHHPERRLAGGAEARTRHWTPTGWSPCIRDAEFESQPDADKVNFHPCVLHILASLAQGSRAASHKPSRRCLTQQPPATQPSLSAALFARSGNPQLASISVFPEYSADRDGAPVNNPGHPFPRCQIDSWEMGNGRRSTSPSCPSIQA